MQRRLSMLSCAMILVLGCGDEKGLTTSTPDRGNVKHDQGLVKDSSVAQADQSGACAAISCYVAADNLCDDYTTPTAAQCTDIPEACATRSGVVAKPAACPSSNFKAKCTMPGAGGYVMRFYGTRGGASDQSFCEGISQGTWSTTF